MTGLVSRLRTPLRDAVRALRMAWAASPGSTLGWGVLLLIQGLLPAAYVLLIREVVDRLVDATNTGAVAPVAYAGLALALVMAAGHAADVAARWIRVIQTERVADHVRAVIHRKAEEIDFAYFETPGYFDDLYRVLHESGNRPLALLESLGGLARDTLTLAAMAVVLLPYGAWLPVALVVGTLPAFLVLVRYNRRSHAWWSARTEDHRRAEYFDDLLTHSLAAAEVRLFDLGGLFRPAYARIRSRLRAERTVLERGQAFARLGAAILALAVTGASMAWMAWRVIAGAARLGDLALFYQALTRGQAALTSMLDGVGHLHEHSLYLRHLYHFLDQEPQVVAPARPAPVPEKVRSGIRFKGVTFRYPGTDAPVLEDFDLDIPAGSIVAVVGENGAGKTTLLKLISRLYDPDAGAVEIDGLDLRQFDPRELRRRIAAVCQFPVSFYATPAEIIALGDRESDAAGDRVEAAARAAGAHERILRLPHGYDTPLGKEFADGHELSGGEWQRLALARAFYREAPILLLDEPTSMLDAWAEEAWLDRLREHAQGRTTLVVTHRYSVARSADMVLVMHEGRIVEEGSHEELVDLGGRYYRGWAYSTPAEQSGDRTAAAVAAYDTWTSA
jgi:ATP-binding cassette, subfamily B, bacterial